MNGKINFHLFECDAVLRSQSGIFAGVDEAGRGPLAGDVYAAAVILPENVIIPGLNDSKKMSEARREAVYTEIIEKAVAYAVTAATVEEIERLNILQAALLAMRRALAALTPQPDFALIDGNKAPETPIPCRTLVKGDGISASVAAASVLAKVERDRYMRLLDAEYPGYGFAKHKGYATKAHYDAISALGITPVHRMSFLKSFIKQE
jgi:ribonuclease HII